MGLRAILRTRSPRAGTMFSGHTSLGTGPASRLCVHICDGSDSSVRLGAETWGMVEHVEVRNAVVSAIARLAVQGNRHDLELSPRSRNPRESVCGPVKTPPGDSRSANAWLLVPDKSSDPSGEDGFLPGIATTALGSSI